jgi:hypothetical protein
MITIQEVHKYLNLVEVGMAKPILCPLDNQHTHMVSWIDESDVVSFFCIACNTKIIPGDNLEKKIKLVIKNFT